MKIKNFVEAIKKIISDRKKEITFDTKREVWIQTSF